MYNAVVLDGELSLAIPEQAEAGLTVAADGEYGEIIKVKEGDPYKGQTVVTPSSERQVLQTTGFLMPADIVIEPIPSNYGLITWDGVTLTVS